MKLVNANIWSRTDAEGNSLKDNWDLMTADYEWTDGVPKQ